MRALNSNTTCGVLRGDRRYTFCLMFIYGCICPCSGAIVLDGSGGGGVGDPASPDEWEPEEEWLRNYMRNVKMHRG